MDYITHLPPKKRIMLSGWGNFPYVECLTYRPEKRRESEGICVAHPDKLLARGAGKSYGDAALNPEGVLLTERLNRFIAFDAKQGVITAEPGVTLAEILEVAIPKGWFLPVIPGTKYGTLGGAVSCNVHGKNHFKAGDFANYVVNVKLRLADGKIVECSPEKEAGVFWATAGGMGMTGHIEEVSVQLKPIASVMLDVEVERVANIEAMVVLFRKHAEKSDYMMGWMDHFGKGEELGRGVFERAVHVREEDGTLTQYKTSKPRLNVPFMLPRFILNKYTMGLYNRLRFAEIAEKPILKRKAFEGFFHPLDGIKNWNRLYGRKGFLQYQCMVPEGELAASQLRKILEMIQESGQFSFLAVIKYHGEQRGLMSFSIPGFSLALDFPHNNAVLALLERLDDYVCEIGGRVYLAKDARLSKTHFERMYEKYLPEWRKMVRMLDPQGKYASLMAERLGFRG